MSINFQKHMNLLVGFFVVSAIIVLVMVFGLLVGYKGIFKPEYHLYAIFDDAIGLRKGTAVLFQGKKIGAVDKIEVFISDKKKHGLAEVALSMKIDTVYKKYITDSSKAYVMRDKNLVSDRVINIQTPSTFSRKLNDKDTLKVATTRDIETVLDNVTGLMKRVENLLIQIDSIVYKVNDPGTTVGALLGSSELYDKILKELNKLSGVMTKGSRVLNSAEHIGKVVEEIIPRLLANADTISGTLIGTSNDLTSLVSQIDLMLVNAEKLIAKLEIVLNEGGGSLEDAGELIDAISDFWFIRGKIKKQKSKDFPMLSNGLSL